MDLLKKELERKRQALQSDFNGKKLLKRSEIEQKRLQRIRDEEHRSLQKKPQSQQTLTPPNPKTPQNPNSSSSLPPALQKKPPSETPTDEKRIDDLVLAKHEVIRRLRVLKQPITLFGEDDDSRLDRLKLTLKSGVLDADSDMTEGQVNDFLHDLRNPNPKKRKKDEEEDGGDGDGDGEEKEKEGSDGGEGDKDGKRMRADFKDLCDEDKILVFFKRLLNEWDQELEETPEAEKRTAKGKSMVATFKQCKRYLNPLFKFCRKKVYGVSVVV